MRPTLKHFWFILQWVVEWIVLSKKLLIDVKSQGRYSSYHTPPTFCPPHWMTVENWSIKSTMTFSWKTSAAATAAVIMMFSSFFLSRCSLHLMTMSSLPTSPLSSQCRSCSCCGWRNAWQCRGWNIVSTMPQCPPPSPEPPRPSIGWSQNQAACPETPLQLPSKLSFNLSFEFSFCSYFDLS